MENPLPEDLLLEAIDELRKRKARPNFTRICHFLLRKHQINAEEVYDVLENSVKSGKIIRVDYKGQASYRNAKRWSRTTKKKSRDIDSFLTCYPILETLATLAPPSADGGSLPVFEVDIVQHLLKSDPKKKISLDVLKCVLDKEVSRDAVKLMPFGGYLLTKKGWNIFQNQKSSPVPFSGVKSRPVVLNNVCSYCLLDSTSNRMGVKEALSVCERCKAQAHPSCLGEVSNPLNSEWVCEDCTLCTICNRSTKGNERNAITCSRCCDSYHMSCHMPAVMKRPKKDCNWICSQCNRSEVSLLLDKNGELSDSESSDSTIVSGSVDEFVIDEAFRKCLDEYPKVVPLANKWSVFEVEAFIRHLGFYEEALAFSEHEIDGVALLLMKRSDVLVELHIKLGPALKIYNHVKRLQSRFEESIRS